MYFESLLYRTVSKESNVHRVQGVPRWRLVSRGYAAYKPEVASSRRAARRQPPVFSVALNLQLTVIYVYCATDSALILQLVATTDTHSMLHHLPAMKTTTAATVRLTILLIAVAGSPVTAQNDDAQSQTFTFGLNFFASSTGYYEVEGYEGVAPELVMEVTIPSLACVLPTIGQLPAIARKRRRGPLV